MLNKIKHFIFILPLFLVLFLSYPVKAAENHYNKLPISYDLELYNKYKGALDSAMLSDFRNNLGITSDDSRVFVYLEFGYEGRLGLVALFPCYDSSSWDFSPSAGFVYSSYDPFSSSSVPVYIKFSNYAKKGILIDADGSVSNFSGASGFFNTSLCILPLTGSHTSLDGYSFFSNQLIKGPDILDSDNNIIYMSSALSLGGSLLIGALEFKGHSNGFNIDLFETIANNTYAVFGDTYHSLYSISDILSASDVFTSLRMLLENVWNSILNLCVLLRNILLAIMWFFDDILQFIRNFWDNLVLVFTSVVNLIVGTFTVENDDAYFSTWLDKWSSSVLFPFLENLGMLDEFENLPFVKLFNDIAAASLGSNGEYQIKNLIVPEDLSVFAVAFKKKLDKESAPILGVLNSYNIIFVELLDNVSSGVVPSFTFPSFTLGGHTYSGFSVDLSPLLPYMPTIRLMLSAWMWISFAVYFIRTLPTIIRGSGTFDSGDNNSSDNMVTLGRMTFDENEILSN